MSRILLVEDHELTRRGARQVLLDALPATTIGEARTPADMLRLLAAERWDLVVLDLNLPGASGLEVLGQLRATAADVKVLILTSYPEEELATRCLRMGASGYLTKDRAAAELVAAVQRILAGGRWVSGSLADLLAAEISGAREPAPIEVLSPRELQVLRLIARGRSLKEIGAEMNLSEKTVASYRARIGDKLSLSRIADLTRFALKHRLLD